MGYKYLFVCLSGSERVISGEVLQYGQLLGDISGDVATWRARWCHVFCLRQCIQYCHVFPPTITPMSIFIVLIINVNEDEFVGGVSVFGVSDSVVEAFKHLPSPAVLPS